MPKNISKRKIFYPSTRVKAMNEIMEFIRNPNWRPAAINSDVLKMLNIAPSKESLVINTLKFLGLINEDGEPTNQFDALKDSYSDTLNTLVKDKYNDVFSMIPGDLIDQERIVNFFMSTSGTSRDTAEYQGMVFGWLCGEAGISLPNLPKSFK